MKDTASLEGKEFEYNISISPVDDGEPDWLGIAKTAYASSTSYLDKFHRQQFEKNLSNFKSKHPTGSKYYLDSYKSRSKLFRPKTRTAVRKNEASIAAALFTTADSVKCEAEDSDDPQKRIDAAYWNEVINYRLDKTIPWFITVVGAFQEAMIYGFVVSKQYWEYEEYIKKSPSDDVGEDGNLLMRSEIGVLKDRPKIRLVEIENIRFDGASDWTDPLNSSPYLIECIPMYLCDVRAKMDSIDEKTGQPVWAKVEDSAILASGKETEQEDDSLRKKREDGSGEEDPGVKDFEIVWVHENIVRHNGQDVIYYTLGTTKLLTQPEPLRNVYKQKGRPYVAGRAVIEAHKAIPSGTVELSEHLQAEANDMVNQRLDNVKLVLNQRKYVDRNADVDLNSLLRSVPGGITLTNDPNAIVSERVADVTSSAYGEQNRLDSDFDEIAGVFSSSSVANNRSMNETVGGMEMMSQFANKETEYLIRTFVETWVEPVLRQLVDLEQNYEDDDHIKDIATKAVKKAEKKRMEKAGEEYTEEAPEPEMPAQDPQNIDLRVNVGFGSLNPEQRIKKVVSGLNILAEVAPYSMQNLDVETVAQEVFGALGHKNGMKFFSSFKKPEPQGDPETELKQAELQMQQQIKKGEMQLKQAELQMEAELKQAEMQLKQQELGVKAQTEQQKLIIERELGMAKIASAENITMQKLYQNLGIEQEKAAQGREKIQIDKEVKSAMNLTKLADIEAKVDELNFKKRTGRQGI